MDVLAVLRASECPTCHVLPSSVEVFKSMPDDEDDTVWVIASTCPHCCSCWNEEVEVDV